MKPNDLIATAEETMAFEAFLNPPREVKTSSMPLTWICECSRVVPDPRLGCACGHAKCLPSEMRAS